jgi:hypothetical protein
MDIVRLAFIVLGPYYLGLYYGFRRAIGAHRVRGIGKVIVCGGLAVVLTGLGQSVTAPSAGITIILAFIILALFFLFGLGQTLGSLIKFLPIKSTLTRVIGVAVIVIPTALIGWGLYAMEANKIEEEKAKNAAIEAFQSQTLTGTFDRHLIRLPVVPSLHIIHRCHEGTRECHTHFSGSAELNMASPDSLELSSIQFLNRRRINEQMNGWCAGRPQLLDTVWCEGPMKHQTGLILTGHYKPNNPNYGTEYQAPDGIRSIICSEHWTGFGCRVTFDIADGIVGYILTNDITPLEAGEEALQTLPRINRIWTEITSGS